jgi:hypothetical protein
VDLELKGVTGPLTCRLVAVGRSGQHETVASWSVPENGYGSQSGSTSGTQGLTVRGATGVSASDISHFDVVTTAGKRLITVPV